MLDLTPAHLKDALDPTITQAFDGGHFTLRDRPYPSGKALEAGLFLVRLDPSSTEVSPGEARRERDVDGSCLVVLEAPATARLGLPKSWRILSVRRFDSPSATEIASFRLAATACAQALALKGRAELKLMIGDLCAPAALRRPIDWAVPAAYRRILAELGLDAPAVTAESEARNAGARRLERLVKGDQTYEARAFGVFQPGGPQSRLRYLVADHLIDSSDAPTPAVALTRPGGSPACATIVAGWLLDFAARGANRYIAYYDVDDDGRIFNKLFDGIFLAAQLEPDLELTCEVRLLSGGRERPATALALSDLRHAPRRASFEALVADASRVLRKVSPEWILRDC